MKRIIAILAAVLLVIGVLPAAAEPYTESELNEYFKALYIQKVWMSDFSAFTSRFIDVDFDGQYEIINMEAGDESAPKRATVYAMLGDELSGRGMVTVGKLEACHDPKTDEYFIISRIVDDGKEICERLVYNYDDMLIETKRISENRAARLEDLGYSPVIITKEQCDAATTYETMHTLLSNAYNGVSYTVQPPLSETYDGEEPTSVGQIVLVAVVVTVAAVVIATVTLLLLRRKKK